MTALLSHLRKPKVITLLSCLLILFFIISTVLTFGPIVRVELTYQYQKTLMDMFHVTDLRALILPQLSYDFVNTKHPDFGMHISALYLDEPIIFNVDPQNKNDYQAALQKGIAHAAGTDLPGYKGLGYYFAHSSSPELVSQFNAVFYLLGKLERGDEIEIWHDRQKYTYVVTTKEITDPNDVSFLEHTYSRPTIVLQTCWPPGTTNKRMLVFAELK